MDYHKLVRPQTTYDWLRKHKFEYDGIFSTEENTAYSYRFPCYKWGDVATIDAYITIWMPSREIGVNVFDRVKTYTGGRSRYAPFYNSTYGSYGVIMTRIRDAIDTQLRRLGIVEKKPEKALNERQTYVNEVYDDEYG